MTIDICAELRQVVVARAELDARRDDLIRQGIAAHISPAELAAAAGVSVQRISQIRRG